ncbi:hypothetical protein MIND_00497200 [Mycena indigotica]|uniref:Nucleoporin Pom152 n=1 Tax=Mycena indigotica TaxID=2126181 RepID=A0A8H6SX52_9AGAR|nr:uncharacterized protein MIND_00497200 [Mycena indigotica]KAF7307041.1 hypothetical protein MIND_00497200 [Mycena indigotica]
MPSPPRPPLIPQDWLDVPSQRLYILSIALLGQAVKLFDFVQFNISQDDSLHLCRKWLIFDILFCLALTQLRIPRLTYTRSVVFCQLLLCIFLDGLMFGGLSLNLGRGRGDPTYASDLAATPEPFTLLALLSTVSFGFVGSRHASDAHLKGEHTVRMSPISTARLNPHHSTFCLAEPKASVLIPILLNNTDISTLRYSLIPLGYTAGSSAKVESIQLTARDLNTIEKNRLENSRSTPLSSGRRRDDEYDEYDDIETETILESSPNLQKTQSLVHIQLARYGTVRLEQVVDSSGIEARLAIPSEVTVVPCPRAEFVEQPTAPILCAGQRQDLELSIDLSGMPPLSLRWFRVINEKAEHSIVEGIDSELTEGNNGLKGVPQTFKVPLTASLYAAGTYFYALEEVIDALGNTVRLEIPSLDPSAPDTKTTRSLRVLRTPTLSFKNCGPASPASLLIGSEAHLTIGTKDADPLDAPWNIELSFKPTEPTDERRVHPWKKTISTQDTRREVDFRANTPGEYTIKTVHGKWCPGHVLSPETCVVVEKPKPIAEIEWKKIHECSGDTGVSASLVLHGVPPFQVYYTLRKDNEPAREIAKTFATTRGELAIQPSQAGHYTFAFTYISDSNYRRVELNGPSIDQSIHPLASASFANSGKKSLSSCAGNMVDIDVELQGTGPWKLEARVVSSAGSETHQFVDIKTARKTLQIPIPTRIDQHGGSFDVDLVSVEDVYECRRPISVQAVSVTVRRVKPTAKFYGDSVIILEHERASLPLRLTGEGPWRLKYRKDGSETVQSALLHSPNDQLQVTEDGLYRIVDVSDAQCPGSVITESSTYRVDWIPRPGAKLSVQSAAAATYEAYNGSFILAPICENDVAHVDLDLKGKPPFELMYNIAQDNENGGTKLLGQPTFNSIQTRTRFLLTTSNPGRIYYEVKQVGDAAYPLSKHKAAVIPRSQRLLFEQQINRRPSARFRSRDRMSFCLHDSFSAQDHFSNDGLVVLEGIPPFQLQLSIKNYGTSHVERMTIETWDSVWKLDLPSYEFKTIGPHLVLLESIADASGCAHAPLDPLSTSVWVDVAETPAIIPVDRREHYCVGDVSQFQLEGIPPWTIGYTINGKMYSEEAKTSPFSLIQQQAGEFTVTSIRHQQKCKAGVTDLRTTVYPLPSAQVGHGKRVYQDIHEGDQAEIVFTLVGEPPFSFTYQRAEASQKKGGKPGKVLETHTVSRIWQKEYSIFSALEGTWTVTSISDAYCQYPPIQNIEKQRW